MGRKLNLAGLKFGRLTVEKETEKRDGTNVCWACKCECGNNTIVSTRSLRTGHTKSCGCLQRQTSSENITRVNKRHGKHDAPVFRVWCSMIARCSYSSQQNYSFYGGRGIRVCDRWLKFENFLEDMGEPEPGMQIDRIDPDGDYCLENCRWTSRKQQCRNRRSNKILVFNGEAKCLAQWAEELKIPPSTLSNRIKNGWSEIKVEKLGQAL